MEATELSLNAVLFGTLYEVVLMFEYVDEILKCDHSRAVLSCGLVYYTVQGSSNFFVDEILKCHSVWCCFLHCTWCLHCAKPIKSLL